MFNFSNTNLQNIIVTTDTQDYHGTSVQPNMYSVPENMNISPAVYTDGQTDCVTVVCTDCTTVHCDGDKSNTTLSDSLNKSVIFPVTVKREGYFVLPVRVEHRNICAEQTDCRVTIQNTMDSREGFEDMVEMRGYDTEAENDTAS